MFLEPLLAAKPIIVFHALVALSAFLIGLVQLRRPEGYDDAPCRRVELGALADVGRGEFVLDTRPQANRSVQLDSRPLDLRVGDRYQFAVFHARRHNVQAHKKAMIGIFLGALVIAGLLTLYPGRIMHEVVFGAM